MTVVSVRRFMNASVGWGVEQGKTVHHQLDLELSKVNGSSVIELDLRGIEQADVSFCREAIVEIVRKYRPGRQFFLANFENEVIVENLDAALRRRNQTGLLRLQDGSYSLIGKPIGVDMESMLRDVETMGEATARQIIQRHNKLKIQNCSNKLKALWQLGLLVRDESSAPSGGREYVYKPVK